MSTEGLRESFGRALHAKVPKDRILFDGLTPSPGEHTRWPCMTCLVEAEQLLGLVADAVREKAEECGRMHGDSACMFLARWIEGGGS